MDIKPVERSIRELLSAQKQYVIPRFQREYSWDLRHYNEFFLDMIANLSVQGSAITPTPYFMGTMLFVGDSEDKTQRQSQVVDGQQRLTTITILFSALSNVFASLGENKLADNVFRYIMSEDDNGKEVRVLKTVTSYPYFSYFIQTRDKDDAETPSSEEEKTIEETYLFFVKNLQEDSLRKQFEKLKISTEGILYLDILKALRDQVLLSTIIEIYTSDGKVANKLFEILNAKGKQLSFIDLIKNKIFEQVPEIEPADFASNTWADITDLINTGAERTGFATFFRQYWASKYKRSTSSTIYQDFKKIIKKEDYKPFLRDLKKEASVYRMISNPTRELFENRKQYYRIVQMLQTFNKYFNVIQVRVPLLALFNVKERGLIKRKKLESVINYLEDFHFAYNFVLAKSPNRVEPVYSGFSIALRQCSSADEVNSIIQEKLINPLENIFPKFDEFRKSFVSLSYFKKDNPVNLKTKYIVYKLNCYYQGDPIYDESGSIEHIYPEMNEGKSTNIGNVILLERALNDEAESSPYSDKVGIYEKSKYEWVHSFVEQNPTWDESKIDSRAYDMAMVYYKDILKREI